MTNFTDLQQVKSGPLFDVFRARLDGRPVYVKSVAGHTGDSARRVALASTWTHSNETNVFHGRHMGWKDRMEEARPGLAHYEALLHAEYTVVERVHQHWNHPGAQLMRRRGDELVSEGGDVCLVIPACEGTPLARFSLHEQREWIPDMLPALWRALAHCPHGDLSPDNLLIDPTRRFFRILDPGVRHRWAILHEAPRGDSTSRARCSRRTPRTTRYCSPSMVPIVPGCASRTQGCWRANWKRTAIVGRLNSSCGKRGNTVATEFPRLLRISSQSGRCTPSR